MDIFKDNVGTLSVFNMVLIMLLVQVGFALIALGINSFMYD